jgi:hypothetical protein
MLQASDACEMRTDLAYYAISETAPGEIQVREVYMCRRKECRAFQHVTSGRISAKSRHAELAFVKFAAEGRVAKNRRQMVGSWQTR